MPGSGRFTLRARYVFPIDAPPLEDGCVVIRGDSIEAFLPSSLSADQDLGNVALLPGFANAHTHLDLSDALGKCPPSSDFVGWLRLVIEHRRRQTPSDVEQAIDVGLAQLLRSGTTMVGDISAVGASWDRLVKAPLRAVVYHEVLGLTEERGRAWLNSAKEWRRSKRLERSPTCVPGISPHAPYSVHRSIFRECGGDSTPIAVHVMESADEMQLIGERRGPFVAFLQELGLWNPDGLIGSWDEIEAITGNFIHGNFLRPGAKLSQPLVYCPRTHAAFGHPPHPFREVQTPALALGTDSLASNPDLNILAEARFLRRCHPDYDLAALLRHLTLDGARSLGFDHIAGSLSPGKSADLVVLPLPGCDEADPHRLLFDGDAMPTRTMFRGQWTS